MTRNRVRFHESADGEVEIRYAGHLLPYPVLDKQPPVAPGEVIENKRLGAVLSVIYAATSASSGSATASSWHSRPKPSSVEAARTVNPASTAPPACGPVGPADRPAPHPPPKVQRTAGPRRPDPRRGIFAPRTQGDISTWQEWGHSYLGLTVRFGEGKMALVPTMHRGCPARRSLGTLPRRALQHSLMASNFGAPATILLARQSAKHSLRNHSLRNH
jgi:hypothetical protein